jgi:hypothetical protein
MDFFSRKQTNVLKGVMILFMLFYHLFNRIPNIDLCDDLVSIGGQPFAYFCYYLFHDFIYGFKYLLVIFVVLAGISYLSVFVIDWINEKCKWRRNYKKQKFKMLDFYLSI